VKQTNKQTKSSYHQKYNKQPKKSKSFFFEKTQNIDFRLTTCPQGVLQAQWEKYGFWIFTTFL
jgi:hypothetical protein